MAVTAIVATVTIAISGLATQSTVQFMPEAGGWANHTHEVESSLPRMPPDNAAQQARVAALRSVVDTTKYSDPGAQIGVTAGVDDVSVWISVRDTEIRLTTLHPLHAG